MPRLSVCFAGTRIEALRALESFLDVVSIVTVDGSRVFTDCLMRGKQTFVVSSRNREASFRFLAEQEVDLVFSAGYPYILPQYVLDSGPMFVNSHPSLLPAYKGNGAIRDAFANGENHMGVTMHHMVGEVDAGARITQESVWVAGLDLQGVYSLLFSLVEPYAVTHAVERIYAEIGRSL